MSSNNKDVAKKSKTRTRQSAYSAVRRAIMLCGGQSATAALYKPPLAQQSVYNWIKKGIVPPERVAVLAKASGIDPRRLNPIFEEVEKLRLEQELLRRSKEEIEAHTL